LQTGPLLCHRRGSILLLRFQRLKIKKK
jgi:hypothetical protein